MAFIACHNVAGQTSCMVSYGLTPINRIVLASITFNAVFSSSMTLFV